jgi:hypothetical protein
MITVRSICNYAVTGMTAIPSILVLCSGSHSYRRTIVINTTTLVFFLSFFCGSNAFFTGKIVDYTPLQTTAGRLTSKSRLCYHNFSTLHATTNTGKSNWKLSDLPDGISPFEKSLSKYIDVQADFRLRAKVAVDTAISNGVRLIEVEFPPLIGGQQVSALSGLYF